MPTSPFPLHPSRFAKGFTLLELLVALAVFTFVAMAAYSGLDSVLFTRAAVQQQTQRLAQVQLAFHILERDIEQAVYRPIRDEFGEDRPALEGGNLSDMLIVFTRTGWDNPLNQPRATLQRLGYRLDSEGNLIRLYWNTLDRSGSSEPREVVLLENVEEVSLRYMNKNGEWKLQWPPSNDVEREPPLPRAVEFNITLGDWGEITRLFRPPEPQQAEPQQS